MFFKHQRASRCLVQQRIFIVDETEELFGQQAFKTVD
jgi:hypothetical protein